MWTLNKNPSFGKNSMALACVIVLSKVVSAQITSPAQPAYMERHINTFLKASNGAPGKPMEKMAPAEAQSVLAGVQASVKVDLSGVKVSEMTITQDGYTVKLTIVKPEENTGSLPASMYFHGGGWMLGDFPTNERLIRDLVISSGTAAIFVNYALSPETRYPVAINQAMRQPNG